MAIAVTCSCGKKLKVKDEWAGKKGKCPGCGASFAIPAAGGAAPAGGYPPLSKRSKPATPAATPKVHLSPGVMALIAAAILIPLAIFLVNIGPLKAQRDWGNISDQASYDVIDVMTRAVQAWYSTQMTDSILSLRRPTAATPTWLGTDWIFGMPDKVGFVGRTDVGLYRGNYGTRTKEVVGEIQCQGQWHDVTGHVRNGTIEAFIDGQPAEIAANPFDKTH